MKVQKMSLANIQGKLSRTEMKKITAGSSVVSCSTKDCFSIGSTTQSAICTTNTAGSCHCPLGDHFCG